MLSALRVMSVRGIFNVFTWSLVVLQFTRCASSDFSVEGDNLVYKGTSGNSSTITMYLKKEELEMSFIAHENPNSPQGIKLLINGCSTKIEFISTSGAVGQFQVKGFVQNSLTVPSSYTKCNPTFESTGNGYKVEVKIQLDFQNGGKGFDVVIKNASLDPSFVKESTKTWIWILCAVAGVSIVIMASVVVGCICYKKPIKPTQPTKPAPAASRQSKTTRKESPKKSQPEQQEQLEKHHDLVPLGHYRPVLKEDVEIDGKSKSQRRGPWVLNDNNAEANNQQQDPAKNPKAIML
ncbi:hypothetical protein M3Y96_00906700 [Aphelenchoides besseyi]|nr:hypothetical protein M3Y96_00906700 [Aphelenchoides besseyi]